MRDGRLNTSKCRGKFQKMGVQYIQFQISQKNSKKSFLNAKKGGGLQSIRLPTTAWAPNFCTTATYFFKSQLPSLGRCNQLFLIGSRTCPPYPNFS